MARTMRPSHKKTKTTIRKGKTKRTPKPVVRPKRIPRHKNPAIPLSDDHTPLGTLSTLPQEVRSTIFRAIMFGRDGVLQHQPSPAGWEGGQFAILHTSKALREEGLTVLRTYGVFQIDRDITSEMSRSDLVFFDQISKLRLNINLKPSFTCCYRRSALEIKAETYLSFFTGTQFLRKECVIILEDCTPSASIFTQSPQFHMISQLTGFEHVELQFYSMGSGEDKFGGDFGDHVVNPPEEEGRKYYNDQARGSFSALMIEMSSALEPTLGPSCIGDVGESGRYSIGDRNMNCSVTFKPHESFVKRILEANSGD